MRAAELFDRCFELDPGHRISASQLASKKAELCLLLSTPVAGRRKRGLPPPAMRPAGLLLLPLAARRAGGPWLRHPVVGQRSPLENEYSQVKVAGIVFSKWRSTCIINNLKMKT